MVKLFLVGFSYTAYLMLNMFLLLDLVLVIRNPFGSKEKRVKLYYAVSYLVSFGMALFFTYTNVISAILQLILSFTYLIAAIVSIIFCFMRLKSTALSQEVKVLIYRRYIYWIVVFLISNIYLIFLNLEIVITGDEERGKGIKILKDSHAGEILAFFTEAQGLFIIFHAIVEPKIF